MSLLFHTGGKPRVAGGTLLFVVLMHALALWGLTLQQRHVAPMIEHPIMVSLVPPEPVAQVLPTPAPPKSMPKPRSKLLAQPVKLPEPEHPVTAKAVSAEQAVTTPVPVELPSHETQPSQEAPPSQEVPHTVEAPKETPPLEPQIEQPRFNADYLNNPAPVYPPLSRRMREEGRVLLRVLVDTAGNPTQVTLRESSGYPRLDERAMETVRRWKFVPARQNGEAVEAWVIIPIEFSLKG